jgi:Protein of unknown function (DUF2971)
LAGFTNPRKLWHYTSIKGFQGIISSKHIFATDLRFLNDRQEFVHTRSLAELVINENESAQGVSERQNNHLRKIVSSAFDDSFSLEHLQLFVASFSAAEYLLSQWRGYSRGSAGTSLGLDLRLFRPAHYQKHPITFAPCVYDKNKQKELLRHVLYRFLTTSDRHLDHALGEYRSDVGLVGPNWPNMTEVAEKQDASIRRSGLLREQLRSNAKDLVQALLRLAALLKDPSFAEEREWRLIVPVWNTASTRPRCLVRAGTTTLIPYLEVPIPGDEIPLRDLILGPGSEASIANQAARSFLACEGIDLFPRESRVPFRS